MNDQAKDVAFRFAEVVEEVARRLRLPDPAPEVIEAAAQDLEQMGRDLRASTVESAGSVSGGADVPPARGPGQ